MTTTRANKLEKLAMSLPGANQKIAQGQQAARQVQLQEQIKNVPQGMGGPGLAQQMGAQQAQQAGQIQLGAQQKNIAQAQQVGQMGLQQMGRQERQVGAQQQLQLNDQQRKFADEISKLDTRYKNQLLDDQLVFRKDEANRTLFNDRQLLDFAASKARSREEFLTYQQGVQNVLKKEIYMLEAAQNKIIQSLQQDFTRSETKLNREHKAKLKKLVENMQKEIERKKKEAKNKAAIWSGVGQIIGGAAAAYASGGNLAAAQAGAKAGESGGMVLGSLF